MVAIYCADQFVSELDGTRRHLMQQIANQLAKYSRAHPRHFRPGASLDISLRACRHTDRLTEMTFLPKMTSHSDDSAVTCLKFDL